MFFRPLPLYKCRPRPQLIRSLRLNYDPPFPPNSSPTITAIHVSKIHTPSLQNVPGSTHSYFSEALKVSSKTGSLLLATQVHSHLTKSGLVNLLSLQNQILNCYVKCKQIDDAHKLFDEMRVRNVVTWNTVICGFVDCGGNFESCLYMGFSYFKRMLFAEVSLDAITFNGLFRGCSQLNDVEIGEQLHCFVVKLGFELNSFVNSALVDLYGKCGLIKDARRAFDQVLGKDLVLWNVMASCYALNSLVEEAFVIFNLMRRETLIGDGFTFSSMLNSCVILGSYELGRQVHGLIIKLCFDLDVIVASGLVDMYAKSNNIDDAHKAFDGMTTRNIVSWNTMVVGFGQHGDMKGALRLLKEMFREGIKVDELTSASVVSSCGSASAACETMQVHGYVVKNGFQAFLSIANALIDAYSKCGMITSAIQCFTSVSEPDLVTWTSLICAYAYHSLPKQSIEFFEKMISKGVRPDQIAFLGVLSACRHSGLVTEGLHYFNMMIKHYQIVPALEHYACLIDLLGRSGLLDEAFNILTTIQIEHGRPDTLGAFIGACKIHEDVKLAKWAAEKLFELEPENPVNYTLMSSLYASNGRWFDVARVQKVMRDRCNQKVPGCSWMNSLLPDMHYTCIQRRCSYTVSLT